MDVDAEKEQLKSDNLGKQQKKKGCSESCRKWIGSASFYIYINFFLSQWGDWMWQFAVGLYLVHMDGDRLLLAAIFGFSGGGCVLLFGGIIGDWVDRNPRLKAVRISLFLQNTSVAASAVCVCLILKFDEVVKSRADANFLIIAAANSTKNASLVVAEEPVNSSEQAAWRIILETAVVATAIAGQLASVAYKIAIEKDWLVVIAAGKSSRLANLNATTRSLDLMCKLVAPITVGIIMTYGSLFVSALCIAVWNIASMFVEYALLSKVYRLVPQLAIKDFTGGSTEQEMEVIENEKDPLKEIDRFDSDVDKIDITVETEKSHVSILSTKNGGAKNNGETNGQSTGHVSNRTPAPDAEVPPETTCLQKICDPFTVIARGWRTYARQKVVFAGMALAFLYMTVLGFDSITVGYIYANNVSALWVGLSMALGGFTGLIGTLLFTRLHRRYGLERTGLIAFISEISCLTLAVASVWTPGSRFNPRYYWDAAPVVNVTGCVNGTQALGSFLYPPLVHIDEGNGSTTTLEDLRGLLSNETDWKQTACEEEDPPLNVSIILLLIGIVLSRVGLWMADLVVTQLMQESILEKERGIVHGVQNSLNMFMDMLKFISVILAPQIEVFGFHILISFSFICAAGGLFVYHTIRVSRGQTAPPNSNGIPGHGTQAVPL